MICQVIGEELKQNETKPEKLITLIQVFWLFCQVLLASCDEEKQLQELRKMSGQNLRLQVPGIRTSRYTNSI